MVPKILTVDDSELNNLLITSYFKNNYEVITALSGMEALEILTNERPDVILLDIMMPKMDGIEVLHHILGNPDIKHIPVIMVTARTELDDVKETLKLGAFDYVKKPIDFTELESKITIGLQIKVKNEQIQKYRSYFNIHESMVQAQRIQRSLLPDKKTFTNIFPDSFILDLPRDIVSGDFYWLNTVNSKKILGVFDCTGHGVPGAMLSIIGHLLLNEIIETNNTTQPNKILTQLRERINNNINRSTDTYTIYDGMDGMLCTIDSHNLLLEYSSAKRPMILVRKDDDKLMHNNNIIEPDYQQDNYSLFEIKRNKAAIDTQPLQEKFDNNSIQLKKGDSIYMYSDGITDQLGGGNDKKFSKTQLFDIIIKNQTEKIIQQKPIIYKAINSWKKGQEQTDDIILIGIKI